jgi:methyl-accepting chemotaxis protein
MRAFSDLRLVWKVLTAPTVAIALMAMVATLLANGARNTDRAYQTIEHETVVPVQQAKDLKDQMTLAHARLLALLALATNDTAGHATAARAVGDSLGRIQAERDRSVWQSHLPAEQAKAVDTDMAAYIEAARATAETAQTDIAYAVMLLGDTNDRFEAARRRLDQAVDALQATRVQLTDDTRERLTSEQRINVLIGIGAALTSMLLAIMAGRLISRPVDSLTATMRQLARRELGIPIPHTGRGDEIGSMARAVEVFRDGMIEAERLTAEQAAGRADNEQRAARLAGLVKAFEAKMRALNNQLASGATELEATAHSMVATASQTDRQAAGVAAAAGHASANVQTVAAAAEQLTASIVEITRHVEQSAGIARTACEHARRTNGMVRGLADGAQKIGAVVGLINTIATRTNLLALNATIEAARAGNAGKGFAVVAAEVKGLATQTAKATGEIDSQIQKIQTTTSDAVLAIQDIVGIIEEVASIITTIAEAVEQQGSATQEIARNVQDAATGTRAVTANIAGVSQAATETGSAATQVLGASAVLAKQAVDMSSEMSRFADDMRAA